MSKRCRSSTAMHGAPSAVCTPPPATSLLDLPASLLDDIARRVMQQGPTAPLSSAQHEPTTALARTCHAFSKASLLHAPAFHIQLDSQRYDQLLTPRIITALRTRTTKLAIVLDQRQQGSEDGYGQYCELLVAVLSKLGSCPAVEACKLFSCNAQCDGGPHSGGVSGSDSQDEQPNGRLSRSSVGKATQPHTQSPRLSDSGDDSGSCADSGSDNGSGSGSDDDSGSADDSGSDTDTKEALDCSPGLAQHLLDSFPGLTALSLHGFSITCSGLASLLSHPQLSPQLQQLDLTHSALQEPEEPGPQAVSWADLMHGVKLKQLSLHTSGYDPFLPNMQTLAQCLTQLHVMELGKEYPELEGYPDALRPLTLLEVLRVDGVFDVDLTSLSWMLRALPRLHTLLLPHTIINGSQELDALLAATQLTCITLNSLQELTSSHAQAPCSWQQLVLTGRINAYTASCLPLHSLTHTFELGTLSTTTSTTNSTWCVAAVHNLTQCCKVAVKVEVLELWVSDISRGIAHTLQRVKELVALLHPLSRCCDKVVKVLYLPELSAASVQVLAPLCQHCTCLELKFGHLTPSLGLSCQLVQLMPSVQQVRFINSMDGTGADMCGSLQQLAEQPWAQCLHINIKPLPGALSHPLPACWQALITPSKPGNFRVSLGEWRQRE